MKEKVWYYPFEIGTIGIVDNSLGISKVFFKDTKTSVGESNNYISEETGLIRKTSEQINEYFNGKRENFEIPLSVSGTTFQNRVWDTLKNIPYSETRTYKEIAVNINSPKACRAVGMANNKNPVCIIIPCHRVIGYNNSLVGYAAGVEIKNISLVVSLLATEWQHQDCL
ncbi:methylated-DNA--protein-cysteine methyltransferase [Clostridia bacterium]|nr:methylated-DNA--protein-cysteine methyltransferase [Clostridia bacterium]